MTDVITADETQVIVTSETTVTVVTDDTPTQIVTVAEQGPEGGQGNAGLSAYEVALANGFVGSEADWLASLQGQQGEDGEGVPLSELRKMISLGV